MNIEKIGLNVIHTPRIHPRDEAHKILARDNSIREETYLHAKWSQETENARLKAESIRVADINKIDRHGLNAAAPNVHFYEHPYRANAPHTYQDVGTVYDILA